MLAGMGASVVHTRNVCAAFGSIIHIRWRCGVDALSPSCTRSRRFNRYRFLFHRFWYIRKELILSIWLIHAQHTTHTVDINDTEEKKRRKKISTTHTRTPRRRLQGVYARAHNHNTCTQAQCIRARAQWISHSKRTSSNQYEKYREKKRTIVRGTQKIFICTFIVYCIHIYWYHTPLYMLFAVLLAFYFVSLFRSSLANPAIICPLHSPSLSPALINGLICRWDISNKSFQFNIYYCCAFDFEFFFPTFFPSSFFSLFIFYFFSLAVVIVIVVVVSCIHLCLAECIFMYFLFLFFFVRRLFFCLFPWNTLLADSNSHINVRF